MRAGGSVPDERSALNHWVGRPQDTVTTRRLRATLRLLLDGRVADALVASQASERAGVAELRAVARRAETRYSLERVAGWLPWRRRDGGDERALASGGGLAGRAALALAFRVGLRLPVAAIAEVLDAS